jgi:EAL domain-containing protein (putative c-di-GMP-specific phosphodiesterase class I)
MLERLGLVRDLYNALPNGELLMHFQPKVDLQSLQVSGAEALIRWRHPQRGILHPESFISFAEKSDLIGPLLSQVLAASLWEAASWHAAGHQLGVAVNIAAANLYDPELPSQVAAALEHHRLPPGTLTVEITESDIMGAHTAATVERLSSLGVRISIDDFGTGYSSLRHLKTLPVDEIKIDRSFVADMTRDGSDAAIVKCVVDLAKNLGMRVVAEGVENGATAAMLLTMGCDEIQGYHVARPMSGAEFDAWITPPLEADVPS